MSRTSIHRHVESVGVYDSISDNIQRALAVNENVASVNDNDNDPSDSDLSAPANDNDHGDSDNERSSNDSYSERDCVSDQPSSNDDQPSSNDDSDSDSDHDCVSDHDKENELIHEYCACIIDSKVQFNKTIASVEADMKVVSRMMAVASPSLTGKLPKTWHSVCRFVGVNTADSCEYIDMCAKDHFIYHGQFANDVSCGVPGCNEPRLGVRGRPRRTMLHFPLQSTSLSSLSIHSSFLSLSYI